MRTRLANSNTNINPNLNSKTYGLFYGLFSVRVIVRVCKPSPHFTSSPFTVRCSHRFYPHPLQGYLSAISLSLSYLCLLLTVFFCFVLLSIFLLWKSFLHILISFFLEYFLDSCSFPS